LLGIDVFCLQLADIKNGGIKSKKMQKIRKKMKIFASGPAQDTLSTQRALSAKTSTYAKRAECAKRENRHLR